QRRLGRLRQSHHSAGRWLDRRRANASGSGLNGFRRMRFSGAASHARPSDGCAAVRMSRKENEREKKMIADINGPEQRFLVMRGLENILRRASQSRLARFPRSGEVQKTIAVEPEALLSPGSRLSLWGCARAPRDDHRSGAGQLSKDSSARGNVLALNP